jgi:acylphosphatase
MTMKKQLKAIITGRVQMVMYRDFAQRKARKLGLVGTVKNLKDGSVEVIVEGEEAILNEYIKYLNKGSILSKVKNVRITWDEASGNFSDFLISY